MSNGSGRDELAPARPAMTQPGSEFLCDICARSLMLSEKYIVSPSEMRVIAGNGYGRHVNLWGNIPPNERESKFYNLAITDNTDWALCPSCYQNTRDFAADNAEGLAQMKPMWDQFGGVPPPRSVKPDIATVPSPPPAPFKPYDRPDDSYRKDEVRRSRVWLVLLVIVALLASSAAGLALLMKHRFDQRSQRQQEAQTAFDQGFSYAKSGKPTEAAAMFEQAVALRPDFCEAYAQLALAYQKLNRIQEAIDAAQRAINLRPNEGWVHRNLGEVYRASGKWSEAIESYKRAVALKPDYPVAYNEMGFCYRKLKQPRDAIAAYKQAIQTKPDYPQAHYGLALAYLDIDDHSSASQESETLKTLNRPDLAKELKKYIQSGEHGVTTEDAAAPP